MTPEQIVEAICDYYSLPGEEPLTPARLRAEERGESLLSEARQVAYWFLVQVFGMGVAETARFLRREHPTVLHGIRVIEASLYKRDWLMWKTTHDLALIIARSAFPQPAYGPSRVDSGKRLARIAVPHAQPVSERK